MQAPLRTATETFGCRFTPSLVAFEAITPLIYVGVSLEFLLLPAFHIPVRSPEVDPPRNAAEPITTAIGARVEPVAPSSTLLFSSLPIGVDFGPLSY